MAARGGEGILRGAGGAAREELLVFGYSCKLFRDDERARALDQGRQLIPWAGDAALRIDRYDARGALHELASLEAPPGGHDWRLELTDAERRVEQLCDEERYRALYCDEEEELMYKEEELKRLHTAGYGQIGFNYDTESTALSAAPLPPESATEADEPFTPSAHLRTLLPCDIALPETQKLNAIIEKTAGFISGQGAQMEILLRAKQAGNPQFDFLSKDCPLYRYYSVVLDAMRHDKYHMPKEEPEVKPEENEDYLHPSLAAPLVEAAPSIPSIHYKPSADCDYTMLISKIKGTVTQEEEQFAETPIAAGELAPPGTEPLVLPDMMTEHDFNIHYYQYYEPPPVQAEISRAPVIYGADGKTPGQQAHSAFPHPPPPYLAPPPQHTPHPVAPTVPAAVPSAVPAPDVQPSVAAPLAAKSTGLNLMHYYNSGSESQHSDSEDDSSQTSQTPLAPPDDMQVIISKMAAYVARNGDEFEDIVKAKRDSRFTFLEPGHMYHPFYKKLMLARRAEDGKSEQPVTKEEGGQRDRKEDKKKVIAPVSFSIKKLKEPESVLPKPALPYESSSDEEKLPNGTDQHPIETQPTQETISSSIITQPVLYAPPQQSIAQPVIVTQNIPSIALQLDGIEERKIPSEVSQSLELRNFENVIKKSENVLKKPDNIVKKPESITRKPENITKEDKKSERRLEEKSDRKSKKRKSENGERKSKSKKRKRARSRSRSKSRRSRSREKSKSTAEKPADKGRSTEDKSRILEDKERREEKSLSTKDNNRSEEDKDKADDVITIGDDDLIDLTGDVSDGRADGESNGDKTKQIERKRRAAAFLATMGKDATTVVPPAVIEDNTLASAMVKTLVELRAKKEAAAERQRARRERKQRRADEERERAHRKSKRRKHRSSDEDDDQYHDSSSKRKKHRKNKKRSSKSKKRKRSRDRSAPPSKESSSTSSKPRGRSQSPSRRSESPDRRKNSPDTKDSQNGAQKELNPELFDADAIKSKLKRLREESEEELEVKRMWRAESECDSERKREREYSEGECKSSEERSTGSDSSLTSEPE